MTVGVIPGTVGDFWRMVWENKSKTIVMITKLKEQGRVSVVWYLGYNEIYIRVLM